MGEFKDQSLLQVNPAGINMGKGDHIGGFNLGSTIVLIFEAPKEFTFTAQPGQKVQFGQTIGCMSSGGNHSVL